MRSPIPTAGLTLAAIALVVLLLAGPASSAPWRAEAPSAASLLLAGPADAGPHRGAARLGRLPAGQDEPGTPAAPPRRHPVDGSLGYGEAIARFGVQRPGHVHQGQDVFAEPGTPLVAVAGGRVLEIGSDGGRGNYVAIHDRRMDRTYVYFHMREPARVRAGGRVRTGERVGHVGCTGSCTGPHLHFEVRRGKGLEGEPLDPLPMLRGWAR